MKLNALCGFEVCILGMDESYYVYEQCNISTFLLPRCGYLIMELSLSEDVIAEGSREGRGSRC